MGFLNEPGAGHFHEELVFCGDMTAGRGFSCTRICSFKTPYPLQSGPKSQYAAIPFEALRKILRPTPGLRMTYAFQFLSRDKNCPPRRPVYDPSR